LINLGEGETLVGVQRVQETQTDESGEEGEIDEVDESIDVDKPQE